MLGLGTAVSRGGFVDAGDSFVGLLDTYTGAAAAYSLRKMRTAYTGSAVSVRRSNDNLEADIGFNSFGELDTVALAAHCGSNDGFVITWYDQASSNDVTQTDRTAQPKIYDGTTGVVTDNGKPAVNFDGSNDGLNCSTNLRTSTGASTVIQVRNMPRTSSIINPLAFYKVQRHLIEKTGLSNYDAISISTNETASEFTKFTGADLSGQLLHIATWDGSSQTSGVDDVILYQDGAQETGTNTSFSFGVTPSGTNSIGFRNDTSSQFCTGTMQEVIVYLSDQSSNRTGIESNINTFYSIF
tara:strand:+ start:312 stop:1205 length:894 start_codon:yes stop_codon:yes gene_type:complete